jgi:hypothetical protein
VFAPDFASGKVARFDIPGVPVPWPERELAFVVGIPVAICIGFHPNPDTLHSLDEVAFDFATGNFHPDLQPLRFVM